MRKKNVNEEENDSETYEYLVKIELTKKDVLIYNCIIYSNHGKDFTAFMPEITTYGVLDFTYELIFRMLFLIRTKSYTGITEEEAQHLEELLFNALE